MTKTTQQIENTIISNVRGASDLWRKVAALIVLRAWDKADGADGIAAWTAAAAEITGRMAGEAEDVKNTFKVIKSMALRTLKGNQKLPCGSFLAQRLGACQANAPETRFAEYYAVMKEAKRQDHLDKAAKEAKAKADAEAAALAASHADSEAQGPAVPDASSEDDTVNPVNSPDYGAMEADVMRAIAALAAAGEADTLARIGAMLAKVQAGEADVAQAA